MFGCKILLSYVDCMQGRCSFCVLCPIFPVFLNWQFDVHVVCCYFILLMCYTLHFIVLDHLWLLQTVPNLFSIIHLFGTNQLHIAWYIDYSLTGFVKRIVKTWLGKTFILLSFMLNFRSPNQFLSGREISYREEQNFESVSKKAL